FQADVQQGFATPPVSRPRHLHHRSGPGAHLRALRRYRRDRHAANAWSLGTRSVFLQRRRQNATRAGGLLRSPVRREVHRARETGPRQLPERAVMDAIKPAVRCAIYIVLGWTSALPAVAQQKPPADRRNFLACPIVRDTKTVPCWLAELNGEGSFLGIHTDTGEEAD